MSHNGYIWYGGAEVINTERLRAYVDAGLHPAKMRIEVPEVCEGLSEAAEGVTWESYRTPIQDSAPWVDPENPDTWDFAGVLPLEITGLDSPTRTVSMVDTLRGGSVPGQVLRSSRTIGVSALLVARTTEGAMAGLAWLRTVLEGSCADLVDPCGPEAILEAYTACPTPINPVADLDIPVSTTIWSPNAVTPPADGTWRVTGGTFGTLYSESYTLLVPYDTRAIVDGGGVDGVTSGVVIDGGGAAGVTAAVLDGGAASPIGQATLGAAAGLSCTNGAPVTLSYRMFAPLTEYDLQLAILDDSNTPVVLGPIVHVVDGPEDEIVWEIPEGVDEDNWRPGLITTRDLVIDYIRVDGYATLSDADCLAPYQRQYPTTVTTASPSIVDYVTDDCVTLLQVEWTWVSGSPYRYGPTDPLLVGMGYGVDPSFYALGVSYNDAAGVVAATPWNCAAPAPADSCALDPGNPGFVLPPTAPVVSDPNRVSITTQTIRRMWVCVGPEQVPSRDGVFTFILATGDAPVVGARVRVWDNAEADCTVLDDCDFAYEYNVDYIPADGVMTIGGPEGGVSTICAGSTVPEDARSGVRGAYGGPVEEPVAMCDNRYLIEVQWLDKYPRTVTDVYVSGNPNGSLTFSVSVTEREG